jgi:transposase InsO family protein
MDGERHFEQGQGSEPGQPPPRAAGEEALAGSAGGGRARGEAEGEAVAGAAGERAAREGPPPWGRAVGVSRAHWRAPSKGRGSRRVAVDAAGRRQLSGKQRLLILDSWLRSKLSAQDFAPMVGLSPHTLYGWKKRFEEEGPAALSGTSGRRQGGSRLSEPTRRAILMLKQAHPDWGEDRLHDVLMRGEGFAASPGAIGRVLAEAGYTVERARTKPHAPAVRRFERARPNELWQSDLFTFVLKRENRRVHLVAFLDDQSRFIVGFGLYASPSGALVREVFQAAIASWGAPREVLTDNGTQYHAWRGKSEFTRLCEKLGVAHIVASPRRPQTLGKIERFWGSLWRECVEQALFRGLDDARRRIGLYIDHYNFQRPHQGIEGLVPADRFFAAAPEVLATLRARVAKNALELARHGEPRKPFYLTGRVGDQTISLFAQGERVVMTREDGTREEVDLSASGLRAEPAQDDRTSDPLPEPISVSAQPADHPALEEDVEVPPGVSPLDEALERLERGLGERGDGSDVLAPGRDEHDGRDEDERDGREDEAELEGGAW